MAMSIAPQAGQRMGGFGSAVFGSRFIEVTGGRSGEHAKVKRQQNRRDLGRTPEQSGSR
jgi:hypothetical protein